MGGWRSWEGPGVADTTGFRAKGGEEDEAAEGAGGVIANFLDFYSYFTVRRGPLFDREPLALQTSFAAHLNRMLAGIIRPQSDETPEERADRCRQTHMLWASYAPRDAIEAMLAAQIVSAAFGALDCMQMVAATQDRNLIGRFQTRALAFQRASASAEQRLVRMQKRTDDALVEPDDAPPPEPLRQAPIVVAAKEPIHPEPEEPEATGVVAVLRKPEALRNADDREIVDTFHAHFEDVMNTMTWPYGKQPRKDSLKRETSYLLALLDSGKGKTPRQLKDEELAAGTALERMELAARRGQEVMQREEGGSVDNAA